MYEKKENIENAIFHFQQFVPDDKVLIVKF